MMMAGMAGMAEIEAMTGVMTGIEDLTGMMTGIKICFNL